jgi:hypothetical protein
MPYLQTSVPNFQTLHVLSLTMSLLSAMLKLSGWSTWQKVRDDSSMSTLNLNLYQAWQMLEGKIRKTVSQAIVFYYSSFSAAPFLIWKLATLLMDDKLIRGDKYILNS